MSEAARQTASAPTTPRPGSKKGKELSVVVSPIQPFRPHRGLFIGIGVMLFAWLALLLVLYFTTIFPSRGKRVDFPGEVPYIAPANP